MELPRDLLLKVEKTTWHTGCPVLPKDLQQITLPYWDYQGARQKGTLIVHRSLAAEVSAIFQQLYAVRFRIARMEPVENFGGNDDLSMQANNTSAFNCRDVTGQPGKFSNHSWGRAIDINPLTNPYVKGPKVLPEGGRAYVDRTKDYPGGIRPDGMVVKLFEKHGWTWGGRWPDRQDYQHFEKPIRSR